MTVGDRLAADAVCTRLRKSIVAHTANVEDWGNVFTLFCLQCEGCGVLVDKMPPMHHMYANALGVLRDRVECGALDTGEVGKMARKVGEGGEPKGVASQWVPVTPCM